ncbi:MAG: metallophosphoesterase [Actinomycetota bacterium]|nr:metallophosphoesterase [Actinomycetota bacterium]
MRTLVISDLHLGIHSGVDVLSRPEALDRLLARLDVVDRFVLLGDTIELRGGPARDALAAAEPVMRAIGNALGPDGEVLIAAGNHDHALAAGWLDWRGRRDAPGPLELEQRVAPHHASWIAKRLAGWLAPAAVEIVYPGVWLRDDVYAMHGHYIDAHTEVPTLERVAAGVMGRLVGAVPDRATPDDYEARLAPTYAWIQASAQRTASGRRAPGTGTAAKAWTALEGGGSRRSLRSYALAVPFRLAVLAANRAGIGPVRADIGPHALRRAALEAIGETARRLRLAPEHLVFGHTHRTGMLDGDDPSEWRTPSGTRLHNLGSWTFETHFMAPGRPRSGPYWPGGAVALDGEGPPRLERLLDDLSAADLGAPRPATH